MLYGPAFGAVAVILTALTTNVVVLGGTRILEGASTAASRAVDPRLHRPRDGRQRGPPRQGAARFEGATLAGLGAGFIVAPTLFELLGPKAFLLNAVFYGGSFLIYRFGVADPAGEREALAARHTGARAATSTSSATPTSCCSRRPGSPSTPRSGCGSASRSSSSRSANPPSRTSGCSRASPPTQITIGGDRHRDRLRGRDHLVGRPVRPVPADDDHPVRDPRRDRPRGGRAGREPRGVRRRRVARARGADRGRVARLRGRPVRPRRRDAGGGRAPGRRERAVPGRSRRDHGPLLGLPRRRARSAAASSAASSPTSRAWTGSSSRPAASCSSRSSRSRGSARMEHHLGPGAPVHARRRRGMSDDRRRPARPGAAGARPARRRRRRRTTSRPRPASRSCGPAAMPWTRRSRRTPSWRRSCRARCGIGGDAFWLIWDAATRTQLALNGSGRAPAGADAAALRARGPRRHSPSAGRWRSRSRAPSGRGVTPTRGSAGCRGTPILAPAIELARGGFPAWDGFIDAVERTAADRRRGARRGRRRSRRTSGRTAGRGGRASSSGSRRWPRPWSASRSRASTPSTTATSASARRAFLGRGRRAPRAADFRDHTSTWTEPIATTYRGVRVTTHPPNSSGHRGPRAPQHPRGRRAAAAAAFGPDAGVSAATRAGSTAAVEAAKLAMADRDAHLTDPEFHDDPGRAAAGQGLRRGARGADRPRPGVAPGAGHQPARRRHDLPRRRGCRRQRGQPHRVELPRLRERASSTRRPASTTRTGARTSRSSPGTPTSSRRGKRTLHTLLPGMLFREPDRPWVVAGSMGGDAQPQVHAQLVSDLVDGRPGCPVRGRRAALVRRAGAALRAAGRGPRASRASRPGSSRRWRRWVTTSGRTEPFDCRARARARDRAGRGRPVGRRRVRGRRDGSAKRGAARRLVSAAAA